MAYQDEPVTRTVDRKGSQLERRYATGAPPRPRPQRVPRPAPETIVAVEGTLTLKALAAFVETAVAAGTSLDAPVAGVVGGDASTPLLPLLRVHVDSPEVPVPPTSPAVVETDRGVVKPTTITYDVPSPSLETVLRDQNARLANVDRNRKW